MTDLLALLLIIFVGIPTLRFYILFVDGIINKMFNGIERDKHELNGYDKIVDQIKNGVCEESLVDVINTLSEKKEERDEYLKRNSDYRDAKFEYVEDRLSDYLNTDEAVLRFGRIFATTNTHERQKELWKFHLDAKREEYEKDFDNL